jgi:hypothetical protein
MHTYGIVNSQGIHIDVSLTEKGAKNYATRNGYKSISIRYNSGCIVAIVAKKTSNGKWIKVI